MHGSLAVESAFLPDPNTSSFPTSVHVTMAEVGEDVLQAEVEGPNVWGDARVEPPRCA
jgi:hypothetical protein